MDRSCEPMDKNRIEGAAEQGERARNCEALVIKAKRRKSGGCAVKGEGTLGVGPEKIHKPQCHASWNRGNLRLRGPFSARNGDSREGEPRRDRGAQARTKPPLTGGLSPCLVAQKGTLRASSHAFSRGSLRAARLRA